MGNKSISNRLTEEVRKLLFSEGLTDKVVGFEIGLITYHGWFETLDINGKSETLSIDENGMLVAEDNSKDVVETFQQVLTEKFYINKILAESHTNSFNHEQMQLIDQIFFDVDMADYDEICRVARVANRNHLLALPVFNDRKQTYDDWKKTVATWYKSKLPTFSPDSFSYIFFLICRSSRNGSKATGSLFLVLNPDKLKTSVDFIALLARCHTLRISLNFLIEHQFGRDIVNLLADPIKNRIAQFIRLTIIQPPKGNKDFSPGWFSGKGKNTGHEDDDSSQRGFIQNEIKFPAGSAYIRDDYKHLFGTSAISDNNNVIINGAFNNGLVPFSMFKSLLSYFMDDKARKPVVSIEFDCDGDYIGLPCRPGWVFAAGLVLLINTLECTDLNGKNKLNSMKLNFVKKLKTVDQGNRWNWSISFMLKQDNSKDGAFGLVNSLYYGKRKGLTAQNLHDFAYLRLNSQEFNNIAAEFTDETESTLATLLIKGATSPVIYYNIEDTTLDADGVKTNYMTVKINWASPVHIPS